MYPKDDRALGADGVAQLSVVYILCRLLRYPSTQDIFSFAFNSDRRVCRGFEVSIYDIKTKMLFLMSA